MSFQTWNPQGADKPTGQVPVTVLSGFLGAGKTTVLNQMLAGAGSQRFAVLVNDLGEVNIDASLIQSAVKEVGGAIAGMLELQGGCICCSIQTDLLDALLELTQKFRPGHILIEATGVAEPKAILQTLYTRNPSGWSGTNFLKVANMVTVLDGGNLDQYLESPENTGADQRTHLFPNDPRRPLQELLVEQIECADVLLINKADTLEEEALKRFQAYLGSLNQGAEVWSSSFGQIDVDRLMQEQRFSVGKTLNSAAWQNAILDNVDGRRNAWKQGNQAAKDTEPANPHSSAHKHEHHPHTHGECDHHGHDHHDHHHHKDYGLETFVFNARTPFDESRFLKVLRTGLPGVIRAKGFYWTERMPTRVGLLSIAGKMLRADYLSEWWHTKIQRGESELNEVPELVRQSWLPVVGDRRQEIVFIGIDLDKAQIENVLKDCFVQEKVKG
ncbi:MAG: CobW family GTP-binding protein [Opitutales bacterium]